MHVNVLRISIFYTSVYCVYSYHGYITVRRETFWHFSGILWLSQACTQTNFPHSYQKRWLILSRWLTRLLGLQVPTPRFSSRLSPTVTFPWLSVNPICSALGPCFSSLSSLLAGNLGHKPFEWISRQNRQRNPLTGALPHPRPQSCHILPLR